MKTKTLSLVSFLFFFVFLGSSALSAPVRFGPVSTRKIKDVAISESVQVPNGDQPLSLRWVTSGLRQKKVAVFWANVYVAQIFSNEKLDLTSVSALRASIIKGLPVVLSMTFVRDVDVKKIVEGFKEGFSENQVKVDVTPYSKFLEAVQKSGDVKDQQTYFFVFKKEIYIL